MHAGIGVSVLVMFVCVTDTCHAAGANLWGGGKQLYESIRSGSLPGAYEGVCSMIIYHLYYLSSSMIARLCV